MGVPGFFAWLLKNKRKLGANNLILEEIGDIKIKWLMLDTNCLLHPCIATILEKYRNNELIIDLTKDLREQLEFYIWEHLENYINDMIDKVKPEYLYVAIDGVAPMGKILQQRQRRYRFLFDKKIKLQNNTSGDIECNLKNSLYEPIIPLTSIELTPGTDYMERINVKMLSYMKKLGKKGLKYVYSSYHEEGEGEHKILQYIKKYIDESESIIIYGLDADLLFLSLSVSSNSNKGYKNLYIMREKQVFSGKEVDTKEVQEYNYVQIEKLYKLIENLDISTNDFILICYLIGNDFLPCLLTTDVKRGGLDKIIDAFTAVKEKHSLELKDINNNIKSHLVFKNDNKFIINHKLLKDIFRELLWTEKHIWKNINRDKYINQREMEPDEVEALKRQRQDYKKANLNKFVKGEGNNTDFLDKIEFSSSNEYYKYYLGLNCLDIDKNIIKRMVKDYISGIEWCISYYLEECKSWSYGYNFMIAPTIIDIINYYPDKVEISKEERKLNPVEQLILAIPPETYKYVIEKEIIELVKKDKSIGYMFPNSYNIDINKEQLYWKCQVKIPIVEYNEYIKGIKKVEINNEKNKIYSFRTNIKLLD
jgi:5'-3' exonuclease